MLLTKVNLVSIDLPTINIEIIFYSFFEKAKKDYFVNLHNRKVFNKTCFWKCIEAVLTSLEVFCKKGMLQFFVKYTGKHLCQSLFFNKIAVLRHG